MDQNLLNGQDDSSKVEAPLSSPPQVADKGGVKLNCYSGGQRISGFQRRAAQATVCGSM